MADDISNKTTDPLPQSSIEEKLSNIEKVTAEILAAQKQMLLEMGALRQEMKERYVDLRERIELNYDKLGVVQRELNQLVKDTRNPAFTTV